jgi:hypothetical protein
MELVVNSFLGPVIFTSQKVGECTYKCSPQLPRYNFFTHSHPLGFIPIHSDGSFILTVRFDAVEIYVASFLSMREIKAWLKGFLKSAVDRQIKQALASSQIRM